MRIQWAFPPPPPTYKHIHPFSFCLVFVNELTKIGLDDPRLKHMYQLRILAKRVDRFTT